MAADFASENLHKNVVEVMKNCAEIEEAVRAGYLKTDQDFLDQVKFPSLRAISALLILIFRYLISSLDVIGFFSTYKIEVHIQNQSKLSSRMYALIPFTENICC